LYNFLKDLLESNINYLIKFVNMLQIPRQQILDRYDTLPESLKDAGFLPYNTLLIKKIGESNHLTEEKISTISQLVGYVLFGFIHPEDLAKEIRESLNLNPEIANSIADEIDRKIFNPIRTDLEKVYAPPSGEEILDLRTAARETKPAEEAVLPRVETPTAEAGAAATSPVEAPVLSPVEAPKILPREEKPEAVKPPEISPIAAPPAPVLPVTEAGPVAASEAEPFIIHKEAEFKPISETKKSLGGLFGFLRRGGEEKLEKAEPVKAEVEIGDKSLKAEPPKITKTEPPKVRVVHYTEFQPAVSPFPTGTEKPKVESEKIKVEIKPPENLPLVSPVEPPAVSRAEPPVVNKVEPPIETKAPISEKIPAGPTPVASGAEPLDLRQAPVEAKPAPETKPVPEKKEEEEMIDLSTFKKI
jgi:hypothetical protein